MKFCIFTVIKDEHNYLDEWIKYHLDLGINRIFIYEDITNKKSHKEITNKYDNVELKSCYEIYCGERKERQLLYFRKFLSLLKMKNEYDWCFFIDIDEFLTFDNNSFDLNNIFEQFNDYMGVELSWQNYNANGHIYKPIGNVIDNYTQKCNQLKRLEKDYSARKLAININKYIASEVAMNIHMIFKGNWCNTDFSTDRRIYSFDKIYIRHYICKSFEEWCNKIFVRGQMYGSKKLDDFFEFNPDFLDKKEECDKIIKRYVN